MKDAASFVNKRLDRLERDERKDMVEKQLMEWLGGQSRASKQSGNDWNGMENWYVID